MYAIALSALASAGWEIGDEKWWCFAHKPRDSNSEHMNPVRSTTGTV